MDIDTLLQAVDTTAGINDPKKQAELEKETAVIELQYCINLSQFTCC